jgi:hypothetical protein
MNKAVCLTTHAYVAGSSIYIESVWYLQPCLHVENSSFYMHPILLLTSQVPQVSIVDRLRQQQHVTHPPWRKSGKTGSRWY